MLLKLIIWIGNYVSYIVYDKFETTPYDTSCLVQNNSIRELTLITCNNFNKKRIVVKAKM